MDRRAFLANGGLFIAPLVARAQQPPKPGRIGFLHPSFSASTPVADALKAGLGEYGYVEGRNIVIESRWADEHYDRLPSLAADLARLKVDVIVTGGTPATIAAKNATTTIPIVMVNTGDAIASGLVANLARPSGNVTGSTVLSPQLMAKRLELLKEAVPGARVFAVILNPENPAQASSLQALTATAKSLRVELRIFNPRGARALTEALSAMTRERVEGLVTPNDALINTHAAEIADSATRMRIPAAGNAEFADVGGLIGYGVSTIEAYRRAGSYISKILNGAKPADLPVEQADKFRLVVNLKTARALGLTIPQSLFLRANEVIQ